jgi:hypothetical protein
MDEIHCKYSPSNGVAYISITLAIGQLEGGQVWEHILLLSTCPILGLSATIGQPQDFSNWIGSVQKEHGQQYSMVEHKHRYSHLRKYVWQMPSPSSNKDKIFRGLKSPAPENKHIRVLHPMSALLLGGRAIPSDLALEAQDCQSLFKMMRQCVADNQLAHLSPNVYFEGRKTDFLKQADVVEYEEALKQVVTDWMKDPDVESPDSPYQKLLDALRNDMHQAGPVDALEDAHSPQVAVSQFIHLLHKLDSQGDLVCVCILLSLSVTEISHIALPCLRF